MNRTIWKYSTIEYGFDKNFTIIMPKGAEILTIQRDEKNNHPTIWAMVDPNEKEQEERDFELFGTGHEISFDMGIERKYIGTYQYQNGEFVGHIFEKIKTWS
jgi:hypothetical protein